MPVKMKLRLTGQNGYHQEHKQQMLGIMHKNVGGDVK
jgi:hypothetical protein